MDRHTFIRFVVPALIIIVAVISFVILTGLASKNPDGLQWSVFNWAGATEPQGGFGGIFAFLGEGPVADALKGGIGIILVLVIAYLFFRFASHKED